MAQKDKIKELVGRSLNSYHTKSLQQIDRIEKKNKEQNHKISILSNELDNDYLTKTEEGSVISLEHSKEGMVYLDELQGNTLVNYCTDGSKEMTLNGDIDVEGTFVTTTEGVDNGKVDVVCEGNTLVNCIQPLTSSSDFDSFSGTIEDGYLCFSASGSYKNYFVKKDKFIVKPSTTYTFVVDIKENTLVSETTEHQFIFGNSQVGTPTYWTGMYWINRGTIGRKVFTLTTRDCFDDVELGDRGFITNTCTSGNLKFKYMILEGDWTSKEIPQHFEGMKSVGQDDENGHKIEILSKNKNLFNPEEVYESGYSFGVPFVNSVKCQEKDGVFTTVTPANSWNRGIGFHVKTEKNKDYTLSVGEYFNDGVNMDLRGFGVYKSEYPFKNNNNNMQSYTNRIVAKNLDSNNNSLTYNSKNYDYILFYIGGQWNENANGVKTFRMSKIEVNQSSTKPTNYTKQNLNKKEILLNEPLRGLPNDTIKDKFVKIGGKWYIERNYSEVIIGKENDYISIHSTFTYNGVTYTRFRFEIDEPISNIEKSTTKVSYGISDKFKVLTVQANAPYTLGTKAHHVDGGVGKMIIYGVINETTTTISLAKEYLANNKVSLVYKLEKPTYEEITDVTLSTYLDITHISNNSIIPCNMKIKNSGYNAIIKPSTLYTVALDTNKSGTIGMNLGGVKGTTTNNVLKLTTLATLTDDSLRLYGKGIKGSKVRILEGDKTNWIPSHFEGMKSSFEDKFDATDNTYKMEILSNNNNLFNFADFIDKLNSNDDIDLRKESNTSLRVKSKNSKDWTSFYDGIFKFKPNTTYTFIMDEVTEIQEGALETSSWYGRLGMISFYNGLTKNTLIGEVHSGKRVLKFKTDRTGLVRILFRCNVGNMDNTKNGNEFILNNIRILKQEDLDISNKSNKIQFSSIEPLRKWDRFVFKDGKLMIERGSGVEVFDGSSDEGWNGFTVDNVNSRAYSFKLNKAFGFNNVICESKATNQTTYVQNVDEISGTPNNKAIWVAMHKRFKTLEEFKSELSKKNLIVVYQLNEPTYEEISFELQKIILEGYENGTLFFDTNIPPTSTVTYSGETPIVKSVKLNKTEVLNNTNDINDNIVPYLMDMDYRVVCLQLQSENTNNGVSMARLFGGTYEMLQRDIQSKRYSTEEYRHRLDAYLSANKITEEEYNKLGGMLNE